jgi:hypothetical protein
MAALSGAGEDLPGLWCQHDVGRVGRIGDPNHLGLGFGVGRVEHEVEGLLVGDHRLGQPWSNPRDTAHQEPTIRTFRRRGLATHFP